MLEVSILVIKVHVYLTVVLVGMLLLAQLSLKLKEKVNSQLLINCLSKNMLNKRECRWVGLTEKL